MFHYISATIILIASHSYKSQDQSTVPCVLVFQHQPQSHVEYLLPPYNHCNRKSMWTLQRPAYSWTV